MTNSGKYISISLILLTLCSIGLNVYFYVRGNNPETLQITPKIQQEYYHDSYFNTDFKIRQYESLPEKAVISDESAAQEIARAYMETVLQKDEKQLSILKTTYQQDYNVWVVEAKPFKMAPWSSAFVVLDKTSGTVINAG